MEVHTVKYCSISGITDSSGTLSEKNEILQLSEIAFIHTHPDSSITHRHAAVNIYMCELSLSLSGLLPEN